MLKRHPERTKRKTFSLEHGKVIDPQMIIIPNTLSPQELAHRSIVEFFKQPLEPFIGPYDFLIAFVDDD